MVSWEKEDAKEDEDAAVVDAVFSELVASVLPNFLDLLLILLFSSSPAMCSFLIASSRKPMVILLFGFGLLVMELELELELKLW